MSDRFEEALARTALPEPDPAWREAILSLASAPRRRRHLPILKLALLVCWTAIGILNLVMPSGDPELVTQPESRPPSAQPLSSLYLLAVYTREIESHD